MTLTATAYLDGALAIAQRAAETQIDAIGRAADLIATALGSGHRLFAFGSGHSHMMVEELYGRAGGLYDVVPMLEPALMLHESLEKSSALERLDGLGAELVQLYGLQEGDVLIVASNSGRNAVPVDVALTARDRGVHVIALTSMAHTTAVTPRGKSGKRLFEVADVIIDNCGIPGDAIVAHDPHPVGATSSAVGALLMQALVVEVVGRLEAAGTPARTYLSLNVG